MRVAMRENLPPRRRCETFDIQYGGQNTVFAVTLGHYDDGRIGEVFITGAKAGSEMEAIARDGAILLSLALQYGVPITTIQHAISREADGKASTIVGAVLDIIQKGK